MPQIRLHCLLQDYIDVNIVIPWIIRNYHLMLQSGLLERNNIIEKMTKKQFYKRQLGLWKFQQSPNEPTITIYVADYLQGWNH